MVRRPKKPSVRPIGFKPRVIKPTQFMGLTPVFWINVVLGIVALVVFIAYPGSVKIEDGEIGFNADANKWSSQDSNIKKLKLESESSKIDVRPIISQIMEKETPGIFDKIVKSTACVQPIIVEKDANGNDVHVSWGIQSGVLFTPQGMTGNPGYMITTFDAVDGADYCEVVLHDDQRIRATILGGDPDSNIGVLKLASNLWINRENYKPLKVAKEVVQGEPVCNCGGTDEWGNANGDVDLQFSFYHGTLSSIKRNYKLKLRNGQYCGKYSHYYQISAPISNGASGGPTVNANGEVIGINMNYISAELLEEEYGYAYPYVRGLNFILPIGYALKIADSIVSKGRVDRSYIGVDFQIITSNDNLKSLIISQVEPGSPAEKGGIIPGDELLMIGPSPCKARIADDIPELWMRISDLSRENPVTIKLRRNGKEIDVNVTPGVMSTAQDYEFSCDIWGLTLKPLTEREMAKRGLKTAKGFFVSSINREGRAYEAGLSVGDIIVSIEKEVPETKEQLKALYEKLTGNKKLSTIYFNVIRSGFTRLFLVKNSRKIQSQDQ